MAHDTILRDTDPRAPHRPSGRFLLRIDPDLHASLRDAARAAGTSLNDYCGRRLAAPGALMDPAAAAVVDRAGSILGDSLAGVVAFGSWARGDDSPASDLDVLLIADDRVAIARRLYRHWDAGPPLDWNGCRVEPHFVHLPPEDAEVSGLWAEAATDGIVIHEREFTVSRRLVSIRRRVLRGELSLHEAHGRPYWVGRAATDR